MKFLANENFPAPSVSKLRDSGHEVISIAEEMSGIDDRQVLKYAVEKKLTILTFDRDYGELLFKHKLDPPPAVIYFRFKGTAPESAAEQLLNILQDQKLTVEGNFTVIEEFGIRQRKL